VKSIVSTAASKSFKSADRNLSTYWLISSVFCPHNRVIPEKLILPPEENPSLIQLGAFQVICLVWSPSDIVDKIYFHMSIGCDDFLGSDKVVDKCGVCGGDNTGCQVVSGVFKHALTSLGYHRVVEIPQGATKINITEMHKSNNYLGFKILLRRTPGAEGQDSAMMNSVQPPKSNAPTGQPSISSVCQRINLDTVPVHSVLEVLAERKRNQRETVSLVSTALRSRSGRSIINGNWAIDRPGKYEGGGTMFTYKRPNEISSTAGESFLAEGPTNEILDVYMMYTQQLQPRSPYGGVIMGNNAISPQVPPTGDQIAQMKIVIVSFAIQNDMCRRFFPTLSRDDMILI
ncbi:hypothetical protein STEG23_036361, partial [Scotinomys teguina]